MEAWHALVLAGGAGSRFGGAKLLAPWRDGVVLDGALAAARGAPVERVTVVTGAYGEAVEVAARAVWRHDEAGPSLDVIHAADHAEGLAATLRAGVASLPASTRGVFVFLGDMPRIPLDIARRLLTALGAARAAQPCFQGRPGHPVLLTSSLFAQIGALRGDAGARAVLDGLGADLVRMDVDDPGVLFDVDTPQDLHS